MTFPQRPKSHVTADKAIQIFKAACPPSWVVADVIPDYGLDLRIEPTERGRVLGREVHVQVKGTSHAVDALTTVTIRQATINYWLAKLAPVLVSLVEIASDTIWYDWLESAYEAYPKQRETDGMVSLRLSKVASRDPLPEEVLRYIARY